ncbi:hypothetical protein C4J81_13615 [Deltaproteobacteria bacterium Smac51]|nr:hypothetical protein C4J81_13615 [Deltaproteobacteria bacterium Smac51]
METPAPAPGVKARLDISSILSRSFAIMLERPGIFLVLALISWLPSLAVDLFIPDTAAGKVGLAVLVDFLLGMVIEGAIAYATFYALKGLPFTMGDSLSVGLAKVGSIVLAAILVGIGVLLGTILLIIPGIIIYCMLAVTIQACVVEDLGAIDSLKRSADLTRGYRWPIFGLVLLVSIGGGLVVGFISGFGVGFSASSGTQTPIIITTVMANAVGVVITAFASIMYSIIYFDLRCLKEGLSLDSLTAVFD